MKLYLIKHKNTANQPYNFFAYGNYEKVKGELYLRSIQVFFKKKDAREYIEGIEAGNDNFEIKTVEVI